MKAVGFNQGQFGDLCMNLIACRAFRREYPDAHLTFGVNKKYASLLPIFEQNPLIDAVHIWDGYDNWPTLADLEALKAFDKVFNPMPQHVSPTWYLERHQTQEVCLMHGLTSPEDLRVTLNRYFPVVQKPKCIAVNMFAETRGASKTMSVTRATELCEFLYFNGYIPIQVGLESDPQICRYRIVDTFFETVKFAIGCQCILTVDSALAWIASGYEAPVVGVYNPSYYAGSSSAANWQPVNRNAVYLENNSLDSISNESVLEAVKNI